MNSDKVRSGPTSSLDRYYTARQKSHMNIAWRINLINKNALNRARKRGVPFDIDNTYLTSVWEGQGGKCALTGVEFDLRDLTPGKPNLSGPSLDKVNPSKGYVKGNVRLVTYQANWCRSEWGDEVLFKFAKRLVEHNEGIMM